MLKKTLIALFATLAVIALFESGANARFECDEGAASAYARPHC
jgi:hypothetical protein